MTENIETIHATRLYVATRDMPVSHIDSVQPSPAHLCCSVSSENFIGDAVFQSRACPDNLRRIVVQLERIENLYLVLWGGFSE